MDLLRTKLCLMETLFYKFQSWLKKAESVIDKLETRTTAASHEQYQKAKVRWCKFLKCSV